MRVKNKLWALVISVLILGFGVTSFEKFISGKITSQVQQELPKATGVSASLPLFELPMNLFSSRIKSAKINIENYQLPGSDIEAAIAIRALNISKNNPNLIGSLDMTVTISESTISTLSGFPSAEIVGDTLQVSVGSGGLGKALLVPKYTEGQLYFELKSVSIFGNEIPKVSLPQDIQEQVKSKSIRNLKLPTDLEVKSLSFRDKTLSINIYGDDIDLGHLGANF